VSCPIELFSTATVPDDLSKSLAQGRKVQMALNQLTGGKGNDYPLAIQTPLPAGRGYGTSTADIGAALYAVSAFADIPLDVSQTAQIAVSIEPTDSTLFPGLALFAHRSGVIHQYLGAAPAATLLIIDPGGCVDSEEFNRRDWRLQLKQLAGGHARAFQLLCEGVTAGDLGTLGEASTLSARLHQEILFNPLLDKVIELGRQVGAAGVCRAHSGTVLGVLLVIQCEDESGILKFCRERLPKEVTCRFTRLTGGGVRMPVPLAEEA
jgi:L-threonine kinase